MAWDVKLAERVIERLSESSEAFVRAFEEAVQQFENDRLAPPQVAPRSLFAFQGFVFDADIPCEDGTRIHFCLLYVFGPAAGQVSLMNYAATVWP